MTNQNNAAQAAEQEIREAFELTYAADADDPACAADLFHFTNGWRACVMSQVRAPVTDEPPGGTHWPVLRAMARNYTAGKHTWDALDANACEQAAEEIRHLRAALASAPVASARAALAQLEAACDTLCRLRTQEQYLSMVDSGQQDALLALDDARAQARAALASAPVAGEAQHDTDSACAWQVWWNQNKSRFTTTRQASIAAFAAGKDWRNAAPLASAEDVRNAALEEAAQACETRIGTCDAGLKGCVNDMDQEARDCASAIRALKQPQADKDGARCTCPSGDGSLRHPCPAHPQTNKGQA
ncbi:hypothetical protein ACOTFH_09550 [Achromobacter xylosoxidans]